MGRQLVPHQYAQRAAAAARQVLARALALPGLFMLALLCSPAAQAQTAQPQPPAAFGTPAAKPKDRLLVDAAELVYDKTRNRVSAVGNVQLYYQGRVLEADRVTYDRVTSRVHAEGNASAVHDFDNWCHIGPTGAVVAAIDVKQAFSENADSFEIVY